jgi:hypothetical protein
VIAPVAITPKVGLMQDMLDRERHVEYVEVRRRRPGRRALGIVLVLAALAVAAFFAFGGDVDVRDKGSVDVETPKVDVQPPDVDVREDGS